jgi:hypothetical protein
MIQMIKNLSHGILYVATGQAFRSEAITSARSVRSVWPDIPIAIFCDAAVDENCFDLVEIIQAEGGNIDKVRHIARSPFERTIFLDTDTFCLQAFPEMFDLLDGHDLAISHESGRFSTQLDGAGREAFVKLGNVPDSFPEFNSGVMAFRRDRKVADLFKRWLDACYEGRRAPVPVLQDQPALRQVIYGSDLRIATLTGEYNFRLVCPGYASTAIKIIHGRWTYSNLANTADEVFATLGRTFNANLGPRVFVHAYGIICGHGPDIIRLGQTTIRRRATWLLRRLLRMVTSRLS